MRQYSYLQAIPMSFYSRNLYRDVAQNWGGGVVVYLLMILAISWIITIVHEQPKNYRNEKIWVNEIVPQLPEKMSIENGEIVTPESRPYIITDKKSNQTLAVIDTSGKFTTLDQARAPILITKHSLIYLDNNDIRIKKIPKDLTLNINSDRAGHFAKRFLAWMWLFLFPLFVFVSWVYRLIESAFYACFGKIFSLMLQVKLTYVNNIKLAMVALTPPIFISTIIDWFNISLEHLLPLYFLLGITYLFFAVYANKNSV